jgi:hypothetical protein
MAFLLRTDGTVEKVTPGAGVFTRQELEELLGERYWEPMPTHTGGVLLAYCTTRDLEPINEAASERYLFGAVDKIDGDALVCEPSELPPSLVHIAEVNSRNPRRNITPDELVSWMGGEDNVTRIDLSREPE